VKGAREQGKKGGRKRGGKRVKSGWAEKVGRLKVEAKKRNGD